MKSSFCDSVVGSGAAGGYGAMTSRVHYKPEADAEREQDEYYAQKERI